jgi:predicted enzyme related to lactoylglutathione lyase
MADSQPGRIIWYELLTTDMKAAEAFYTAVVGWTVTPFSSAGQPYDMFNRAANTPIGGVMAIPQGMNFPPHWEMYVVVANLEEAVRKIEGLGGRALGPLVEVPEVGRMRTMTDPQGAVFAIHEMAGQPDRPEGPPEIGDGSWHELMTTDAPAAQQFYSDLFGWTPTEPHDMGPDGKYYMFARQFPLGGMMTKTKDMAQVPTAWSLYFRVNDVSEAADRVKANGGQVLNGPMEVPGGDRIVNCLDPQGAAFSLHQRKG